MLTIIIIPAYNEEKTIGRVISGLFQCGYKNIVVVDDGSKDRTAKIAEEAGAKVLCHLVNRGQGAALETGNEYARMLEAEYVVHFDGDGQFNPSDISSALECLNKEEIDVILGSRFLDNRSQIPFLKRRFILPIGRWVNFLLTKVKLTDVHNGFRIFSKKALQTIRITQDRMAHNSEIIMQIKKYNLNYKELPVEVVYTRYGQGIGGGFVILRDWFLHHFSHNE